MQIDLFDILYPTFKFNKEIKALTLFSGIGFQEMGMDLAEIPYEMVGTSEIDKFAILSYAAIHTDYLKLRDDYDFPNKEEMVAHLQKRNIGINLKTGKQTITNSTNEETVKDFYLACILNKNFGDVSKLKGKDIESEIDLLTYSFPCVLENTKINTKTGYKKIENVELGDYVLTHENRLKKVTKLMERVSDHYYDIRAMGVRELYLTEEHPLYVSRNDEEMWVDVKDLQDGDYLSFNVNSRGERIDLSDDILWLLGRYVADGYITQHHYNSIHWSIGRDKVKEFENKISDIKGFRKNLVGKNVYQFRKADKELQDLCREFGVGALEKKIPNWVINLPLDQLQHFFDGYISGDGHIRKRSVGSKQIMWSTVSEDLGLGLQQIAMKLYKKAVSLYIRVDNRSGTFNNTYNYQMTTGSSQETNYYQFYKNNKLFVKLTSIERIDEEVKVYNLEVEEDNSYTCNNVIVHNCTDLSKAGQRAGLQGGTRSGLVYEVLRLLHELHEVDNLPKVLIMENVIDLIQANYIDDWNKIALEIEQMGYTNFTQILNAKDYGIAQNRQRVFMVSILGEYNYNFPKPIELKYRLKDYLEDEVDESLYLSDKAIQGRLTTNYQKYKLEENIINDKEVHPTILARYEGAPTLKDESEKPFIPIPEATDKGWKEAYEGDGVYHNRPHQKRGVVQDGMIQTLKANNRDVGVVVKAVAQRGRYNDNGVIEQQFETGEDISNALTTVQKDMMVVEGKPNAKRQLTNAMLESGNFEAYDMVRHSYTANRMEDLERKEGENNIGSTLTTRPDTLGVVEPKENYLRIRKLSPRETARLMGMQDYQFDKQIQVTSDAQAYKQHGNGIVAQVIGMIIGMMWYENENELNEVVERNSHTWLEKESK